MSISLSIATPMEGQMAREQLYSVALTNRGADLSHSVTLVARNLQDAEKRGREDAGRENNCDAEEWDVTGCEPVPAPLRRAA